MTEEKNSSISDIEDDPCSVKLGPSLEKVDSAENPGKREIVLDRDEKGPVGKVLFVTAWIFLFLSIAASYLWPVEEGQQVSVLLSAPIAGANELIKFIYDHLVSAMIPAFFLAAAISTFFSKETLLKTMGKETSIFISYPLAALAGAILTVCSCGVLPIFMSILQTGAGMGPACTFLFASPAINLISMVYTWKILPPYMLYGRVVAVIFCAIGVGFIMGKIFQNDELDVFMVEDEGKKKGKRSPMIEWGFFCLLVLIMLTSTGLFAFLTDNIIPESLFSGATAPSLARLSGKLLALAVEIALVLLVLRIWFTWDETRKWLKRTGRQAMRIMPMVFLGVFYSGFFGGAPSMVEYLPILRENTVISNLLASFVGAMLYFGSIVGVNVIKLFHLSWGVHAGPALALLLSGPTVSLPSILALVNIVGKKKALVFLFLAVVFSATSGLIFGNLPIFSPQ